VALLLAPMLRRALREYMDHYHLERKHQGLENKLIATTPVQCSKRSGSIVDPASEASCGATNAPRHNFFFSSRFRILRHRESRDGDRAVLPALLRRGDGDSAQDGAISQSAQGGSVAATENRRVRARRGGGGLGAGMRGSDVTSRCALTDFGPLTTALGRPLPVHWALQAVAIAEFVRLVARHRSARRDSGQLLDGILGVPYFSPKPVTRTSTPVGGRMSTDATGRKLTKNAVNYSVFACF
jgi:hypothetical protein